jgi:hypothetical protein
MCVLQVIPTCIERNSKYSVVIFYLWCSNVMWEPKVLTNGFTGSKGQEHSISAKALSHTLYRRKLTGRGRDKVKGRRWGVFRDAQGFEDKDEVFFIILPSVKHSVYCWTNSPRVLSECSAVWLNVRCTLWNMIWSPELC